MRLGPVDLGPALEQRLFFALRDGDADVNGRRLASLLARATGAMVLGLGRVVGALLLAFVPRRRPAIPERPFVAIVRQPVHVSLLGPIDAALRRAGHDRLAIVRVGLAAAQSPERPRIERTERTARLEHVLIASAVAPVVGYQLRIGRRLAAASGAWRGLVGEPRATTLRHIARRELPLIALGAAGIASVVDRWRPSILLAYDELGTWSRIIAAVGRTRGVPTLDLPHAEAVNRIAIAGADYDRFAVFGPRATAALVAAGIDRSRIVETGAPHFDALATRPHRAASAAAAESAGPRLVLLAAQYVQGAMTLAGLEACHRAALAAAAAVAPAEVLVMPHPLQQQGLIEGIVGATPVPACVAVRVEHEAGLHDRIDDAWLLVTGWSNSVFEAALRGVPALLVDPFGVSPVRYDEEGLGIGVGEEASAAAAARSLLDPTVRAAAVARASVALTQHLGPSDGRAAERTARLMLAMSGEGPADEPARD
ncbi:MAG TPA: hypothetical protein VF494_00825 [Candidatus Limnocylindrales bacterium]